ncbi:MAG: B12-binding domain-containing radical SAM protein [Treponema sp.]|nr:B12-binding domain-containing radical SAM protein [Treponema sp.]
MCDILLVAVNSSFSHTNIAVRYLKYYADLFLGSVATLQGDLCGGAASPIQFCEFTINQPLGEIIRGINLQNPKIILFSTYIWNIETVVRIAKNIKALRPELVVAAGGPEAGFRGKEFLQENPEFDLVMKGEGEETFCQLVKREEASAILQGDLDDGAEKTENWRERFLESLKDVKGLYLRNPSDKNDIFFSGEQELICDMGKIPFPYPDLEKMDGDHKIFYYESSRGCPFSCAYCMSSLDTKVRFVPLEKVYKELQRFLDAGVKLVKFVDRTYNLKPERYISIWKYIMEHHNGKTMFHFEIEGEFLSEEAMEFLQTVPEGIMQFEIGVQSSNPKVLNACGRSPETETLRKNILRIPKTIHTHLDLIAGLPFEDLDSFGRSFDFVMSMEPDALQLGFLKVLFGAPINQYCSSAGWKWMATPPYEILETPYLSYEEILFLKDLESCLDAFWNDHHFDNVMRYLSKALQGVSDSSHSTFSKTNDVGSAAWWKLFVSLTKWLRTKNAFSSAHQKDYWAQMFYELLDLEKIYSSQGGVAACGDLTASKGGVAACTEVNSSQGAGAACRDLTASQGAPAACRDLIASQGGVAACTEVNSSQGAVAACTDLSASQILVAQELLRFDYIAGGKKTNPPSWLRRNYDDQGHYDALQQTTGIKHSRLDFVYSDFDTFLVNPLDSATWHSPLAACTDLPTSQGAPAACKDLPASKGGVAACKDLPASKGAPAACKDLLASQGAPYPILFLYARKESDRPTDFQRVPHQILIKR